jgi:hypothetical protein
LTSVFCGEFPASVMIPLRGGGRGRGGYLDFQLKSE